MYVQSSCSVELIANVRVSVKEQTLEVVLCSLTNIKHLLCMKRSLVDGGWSSWGSWEKCRGLRCDGDIRFRKCDNPAPRYDGRYCPGAGAQKMGGEEIIPEYYQGHD